MNFNLSINLEILDLKKGHLEYFIFWNVFEVNPEPATSQL